MSVETAETEQRPAVTYELYCVHDRGIRLRLTDKGVTPGETTFTYVRHGQQVTRPYSDFRSVRLQLDFVPRQGNMGTCTIAFREGREVQISSAGQSGVVEPHRIETYREFVRDLHHRLLSSGAAERMWFYSCNSQARDMILSFALVLAGMLFVVTPMVLVLFFGAWEAVFPGIAGTGLFIPFFQAWRKNRPRTYDPRWPPDHFTD